MTYLYDPSFYLTFHLLLHLTFHDYNHTGFLYMSRNLNSLKGGYMGDYIGDYYRGS